MVQSLKNINQLVKKDPKYFDYLEFCLNVDKNDSTSYSEKGLDLFENGHFDMASIYFKKPISIGPPAVEINLFYLGKCYEHLGYYEDFLLLMYEVIKNDDLAISPYLELLSSNISSFEKEKLRNDIRKSKALLSLLSEEEKCHYGIC